MFDYYVLLLLSTILFLMVILEFITPFIIRLANKNKDYRNKKIFIIYKKSISILFFLHMVLTLIIILIGIFNGDFIGSLIDTLIIGGVGFFIIYGIYYFLNKNNIDIDKSIANKMSYVNYIIGKIFHYIKKIIKIIVPIIAPIIIPICILIFVFYIVGNSIIKYIDLQYLQSLSEIINKINDNIGSEYTIAILLAIVILLVIAIILVAVFFLFFIFLVIMINSMVAIINQKLNIINKNIKNNKSASSTKLETTKKYNNDNDYMI